jgi:hypothetical protein
MIPSASTRGATFDRRGVIDTPMTVTRCRDSADGGVRRDVAGSLAPAPVVVVPRLLDGAALPEEDEPVDPIQNV